MESELASRWVYLGEGRSGGTLLTEGGGLASAVGLPAIALASQLPQLDLSYAPDCRAYRMERLLGNRDACEFVGCGYYSVVSISS